MLWVYIMSFLPFGIFFNVVVSLNDGEVVAISHFFIEFSRQFLLVAVAKYWVTWYKSSFFNFFTIKIFDCAFYWTTPIYISPVVQIEGEPLWLSSSLLAVLWRHHWKTTFVIDNKQHAQPDDSKARASSVRLERKKVWGCFDCPKRKEPEGRIWVPSAYI